MSNLNLSEFQKDALREMGNVGAGNAATALSQLLNKDISIDVPRVIMVPADKILENIPNRGDIVAAVYMRIFGEITGRSLMIFPQDRLFLFLDLLMKKNPGDTKEFGDTEQSAIREVGNIIISSYLNAIAKLIGLNSVPSVPALAVDVANSVFETISAEIAEDGSEALMIENEMVEEITKINCQIFIMPDKDSMQKILKALNNAVGF